MKKRIILITFSLMMALILASAGLVVTASTTTVVPEKNNEVARIKLATQDEFLDDYGWVDWYAVAAETIGIDEETLWESLEKGQSLTELAESRNINAGRVTDAIIAAEIALLQKDIQQFMNESWKYQEECTDGDCQETEDDYLIIENMDYFEYDGPFRHPDLTGPEEILDTDNFRIHYTLSGRDAVSNKNDNGNNLPDYVEAVAEALEYIRDTSLNVFNWVAPPTDDDWGGNSLYDVYLLDLLSRDGTAGYVDGGTSETIVGDNPNSPNVIEKRAAFSVMALDNDYIEVEEDSANPIEVMQVSAAHEYFHAIQFGYDGQEPADWIWEATATWMQDEIYDGIDEDTETIAYVVESPSVCQIAADPYGMWIFFRYISENYGHNAVKNIWEQARTLDGYDAIEAALGQYGTSLDEAMKDFAVAILTRDFEEGADYPTIRLEGEATGSEFAPETGVGQMGFDFVEIKANGITTITLNTTSLIGNLIGIGNGQATVFNMPQNSTTVDPAAFDHLYLIVVNLNRAQSPESCNTTSYTVTAAPGNQEVPANRVINAPNFLAPQTGELDWQFEDYDWDNDDFNWDDGWDWNDDDYNWDDGDDPDWNDDEWVDWYTVTTETIGISENTLFSGLDRGQSLTQIAKANNIDPLTVIAAITAAEKNWINEMLQSNVFTRNEAKEWLSTLDFDIHQFMAEKW